MKSKLLIYALLLIIYTFGTVACKQRHQKEDLYLDSLRAEIETQDREKERAELTEFAKNCDEKEVEAKFKEWMELYYPDWPIKGKFKVFEAPQDRTSILGGPCPFNIRFQTINPHMGGFGNKEIVIVRFDWNSSDYQEFSIKPVRGRLY